MKFGLILSLTAVLVVFAALTVLYFCYLWIGKAQNYELGGLRKGLKGSRESGEMSPEVAAAVATALEKELGREDEIAAIAMALEADGFGEVHDVESYVITIRR